MQTGDEPAAALESLAAGAIGAASAQIELAMREARPPVDRIGTAMACTAYTLQELRSVLPERLAEDGSESPAFEQMECALLRLQSELSASVESLQFFDGMVQHLTHVCDYLTSIANGLATTAELRAGHANDEGAELRARWDTLRASLRERLPSLSQRQFLDMFLPPPDEVENVDPMENYAARGSIDLFEEQI